MRHLRLLAALLPASIAAACSKVPLVALEGGGGTGGSTGGTATTSASTSAGGADGGPACAPDTVYVAPQGAGDACSCAAPCALDTGRDHARALVAAAAADVVVELADGVYRRAQTFALGAADSGASGHAIVYRAAPGAAPVLSGAIAVSGFAPVGAGSAAWVAGVPTGTQSRQLYVNGRRATRARGPLAPAGFTKTATGFALGDAAMAAWPDRLGIEVTGTRQWKSFRCPVSAVSAAGVTVAEPCWTYSQAQAGVTWDEVSWIENALELLDEGGEWHLDGAAGKLYYQPRAGEDLATAQVELPVLEELVRLEGTPAAPIHDVAFEGITFAHATWLGPSTPDGYASLQSTITPRGAPAALAKPQANVTVHAGHAVRFTGCRFAHLGGAALALEVGAQDNLVDRCRFEDTSAAAVMIGDVTHVDDHHPADPALVVKDNVVRSSYVTRAGAEYLDAVGIFVGYTTHTVLDHNELFDLPYSGISVGWGWGGVDVGGGTYTTPSTSSANELRNNVISHHLRALRDGGGIYVLGAQAGSVMDGNVVENQAAPFGNLYLDNGTQGYTLTSNVVLLYPKQDVAQPDPDRSYWLYVQVFPTLATHNVVGAGNLTNDVTPFTPQPIDPSNALTPPVALGADLGPASALLAAAGSPLRSPEIAAGKPSTASSEYDASHPAAQANDRSAFDGWSPKGDDAAAYWQVDLGGAYLVDAFEVVSRWGLDQPVTRRSYRVLASEDPSFAAPTVLGEVDATGLPHRAVFAGELATPVRARYVRVAKTAAEYFFLAEVRVHGRTAP